EGVLHRPSAEDVKALRDTDVRVNRSEPRRGSHVRPGEQPRDRQRLVGRDGAGWVRGAQSVDGETHATATRERGDGRLSAATTGLARNGNIERARTATPVRKGDRNTRDTMRQTRCRRPTLRA